MTHFPSDFDAEHVDSIEYRRTSGMAIASLICSLICCIPGLPLIGALLGLGGIVTIRNNPHVQGTALAVAGLVLGLILTVIQSGMIYGTVLGFGKLYEVIEESPPAIMQPVNQGDINAFRNAFHGAASTASDAEVQQFMDTVTARYGRFVSAEFKDSQQTSNQQTILPFEYVFEFDGPDGRVEVDVTIEIVIADQQTGQWPLKPASIVLHDQQRGPIEFPQTTARRTPPPTQRPPDPGPPPESDASERGDDDGPLR